MKRIVVLLFLFALSYTNAQIVTIPDANFKNALLTHDPAIDTNDDGEIQVTEAEATTSVNVYGKNISDLTGIEAFINLTTLYCSLNNLSSLNLNSNSNLEMLGCNNNSLTSLNLSSCTNLQNLTCSNNLLTELDVSNHPNLSSLECQNNELANLVLDTSVERTMYYLLCSNNNIASLDVSNISFTGEGIYCDNNELSELIMTNASFDFLMCNNNQLTSLDFSAVNHLFYLDCNTNFLNDLDVKNFEDLNYFISYNNPDLNCIQVFDQEYSTDNWHEIDSHSYFRENCDENSISDFSICDVDWDGSATFDLSQKDDEIINGAIDVTLTYHISELEAENSTGSLATDFTNTTNPQQIFTRLENNATGDFTVNSFFLKVNPPIDYTPVAPYRICDFDSDGFEEFDLTKIVNDIKSENELLFIRFYETETNANTETSALTESVYTNTIAGNQTIYARVEDFSSDCFIILPIELIPTSCLEETYVPDDNFEQHLIDKGYDDVLDDYVMTDNIQSVSFLMMNSKSIASLEGLNGFLSLQTLYCRSNNFTDIDVSNNLDLRLLDVYNNNLDGLDITNNTVLNKLYCSSSHLTDIDLTQNTWLKILNAESNSLSALDLTQNTLLKYVSLKNNNLSSIDISNNSQLYYFNIISNEISEIDLTHNPKLIELYVQQNLLSEVDVSENTLLQNYSCDDNSISTIDLSTNIDLRIFKCSNNLIDEIDLSNQALIRLLFLQENENLQYINLKNGNNDNFDGYSGCFNNLPSLMSVCIDDITDDTMMNRVLDDCGHAVTFTEYCSSPLYNTINGNVLLDLEENGCDETDIPMSNLMLVSDNGTESFATFTQTDGSYLLHTNEGDFNTSVTANLPDYFTVNPDIHTSSFTGYDNVDTADFCVTPNETVNDISISLYPLIPARPGIEASYQLVYSNVGTTVLTGDISLSFYAENMTFATASEAIASQTYDTVSFDYNNLNPFETRTIDVSFNITPETLIDTSLEFVGTINPIAEDNTPEDNTFVLEQTVVDSYDPNDIHVLEGSKIKYHLRNNNLHYLIRFQNTGTAEAINIVVTNNLDANLDWTTLQLENMSHTGRVAITNGNQIEFIFENIYLPDSSTDEANSHGYIAYKIKPKSDIMIGDIIPNQAHIFFDYNAAVDTNIVTTEIIDEAGLDDSSISDLVSVYPIPASDSIHILSDNFIITEYEIVNQLGQITQSGTLGENEKIISVSNLKIGFYTLKLKDNMGRIAMKKILIN